MKQKFSQFIIDVYNEWNKESRCFEKIEWNVKMLYKNFFGILYNSLSNSTFDKIINITAAANYTDMLFLCSRVTDQEVQIYEYDLQDYKIDGDELTIILKNKTIVFKM